MHIIGGDIARMGRDQSVGILVDNEETEHIVHGIFEISKTRTREVVNFFEELHRSQHPMFMAIDAVFNPGVVDELVDLRYPVFPIIGGAVPSDPQFFNLRSELYWRLRRRLERREVKFLNLTPEQKNRLLWELTNIKYEYTLKDKIRFESKEDMIKRIGKSPDYADALSYTCVSLREWDEIAPGDMDIAYGDRGAYDKSTWARDVDKASNPLKDVPYAPELGSFGATPMIPHFGTDYDIPDDDEDD